MQFKIFVSYSTHDIEHVELLKQQLKGTPIEVFIAEHSVKPSEDLGNKISTAIEECDLFVVLWSQNAKESTWVPQEIGRAHALKKTILPLVLHEGISLPGFISNLKYLAIFEDTESALIKAKELIMNSYHKKVDTLAKIEAKKQKDKETLALMGIGAFLLWAFNS
jgi:hypothetical protein